MENLLSGMSGLAWTIVYIEAIRLGFTQRTYAIPIAALGLNFAWEWTYAVHDLAAEPGQLQTWVNVVWALADLVILYTFFRFGRRELPSVPRPLFVVWGVAVLATSFVVQWLFIDEFAWPTTWHLATPHSCRTCSCRGCSSRCSTPEAERAGRAC